MSAQGLYCDLKVKPYKDISDDQMTARFENNLVSFRALSVVNSTELEMETEAISL